MFARVLLAVLSLSLIIILAGSLPLHAVTPHSHSHSGSEEVSSLWASFHASLRSEEKKVLLAVVGVFSAMFYLVAALQISFALSFLRYVRVTRDRPQQLLDSLRNGALPYRRFV